MILNAPKVQQLSFTAPKSNKYLSPLCSALALALLCSALLSSGSALLCSGSGSALLYAPPAGGSWWQLAGWRQVAAPL